MPRRERYATDQADAFGAAFLNCGDGDKGDIKPLEASLAMAGDDNSSDADHVAEAGTSPSAAQARGRASRGRPKQGPWSRGGQSNFEQRHRENRLLILHLYDNHQATLHDEFRRELRAVDESIDYSELMTAPYRGRKSMEERRALHRSKVLLRRIGEALGDEPGVPPRERTVGFAALASDPSLFMDFVRSKRQNLGPAAYDNYKLDLVFLFRRYGHEFPAGFKDQIQKCMARVKRDAAESNAVNNNRRVVDLRWKLYRQINDWFLELGSRDGVVGAAASKLAVCLAGHGDQEEQGQGKQRRLFPSLRVMDLSWSGDSFGFPLAPRLPRDRCCDPLDQSCDFASSAFHHLVLHVDLLMKPRGSLMPASIDAQVTKFNNVLKKVLTKNVDSNGVPLCESQFGVKVRDLRMKYWIQRAPETGPDAEGPAIPGASFVAQEVKLDGNVRARVVAELPVRRPEFAYSYPDFIPVDVDGSLAGSVTESDYLKRKAEVDAEVRAALDSIFGLQNMAACPGVHPFLRVGLASHLHHFDAIDDLVPREGTLRQTPLFTNPAIAKLKQHVRIAVPWEDGHVYFAVKHPPRTTTRRTKDGYPMQKKAKRTEEELFTSVETSDWESQESGQKHPAGEPVVRTNKSYRLFDHPDGTIRRVPLDWQFPHLSLQDIYVSWHCMNELDGVAPMKYLNEEDVKILGKKGANMLSDLRKLMVAIDLAAKAKGLMPEVPQSRKDAIRCFDAGRDGINVPLYTASGRLRDISVMNWSAVSKLAGMPHESMRMSRTTDAIPKKTEEILEDPCPTKGQKRTSSGFNEEDSGEMDGKFRLFDYPDGVGRRIPPDWYFPNLSLRHMYIYWHCGSEADEIAPLKNLDRRDLQSARLGKRGVTTFRELRTLMNLVDTAADAKGAVVQGPMTLAEAASRFDLGQDGVVLPPTPTGKQRSIDRLTWSSALRLRYSYRTTK